MSAVDGTVGIRKEGTVPVSLQPHRRPSHTGWVHLGLVTRSVDWEDLKSHDSGFSQSRGQSLVFSF